MIAVLLVGPEVPNMPTLKVTQELLRIGDLRGVELTPLVGPGVTAERVLDRLSRQRYDVVVWSGHGTESTLLLSDGRSISPNWLASQLARHEADLAVLAACKSGSRPEQAALSLGFQDVLPKHGITLVAMTVDMTDTAAAEYNVALLQALEAGATVRRAHEAGLEAAAVAGDAAAPQLFVADGGSMGYNYRRDNSSDQQLLRTMSDKLDRFGNDVGDIKTRQAVMETNLQRLMEDMRTVKAELADMRKGTFSLPRVYLVVLVGVALLMLTMLMLTTWRVV